MSDNKPDIKIVPAAPPPPLSEDRWALKEYRNPGHWINVAATTTLENLLEPVYWANVARHMKPCQTIEVHWDDRSQYAELYILDADRNWASVDVLFHKTFKHVQRKSTEEYEVQFNGPTDLFRVLRKSDRGLIKAGFATEAAALKFLAEHKRKLDS